MINFDNKNHIIFLSLIADQFECDEGCGQELTVPHS